MIHLHKEMIDELGFKNVQKETRQPHKKGQGGEIISVNKCKDIMTASERLKNKFWGPGKYISCPVTVDDMSIC